MAGKNVLCHAKELLPLRLFEKATCITIMKIPPPSTIYLRKKGGNFRRAHSKVFSNEKNIFYGI